MAKADTVAEILLMKHMGELGLGWNREFRFDRQRKWRFDFALFVGNGHDSEVRQIGIEIEGGAWTNGRHTRGKGFEADIRKYNEAAKLGWTVIRFTPSMIQKGESKAFLQELFGSKP